MKLSATQLDQITSYFKNEGSVAAVYLYGSQADESANPESDIDLGVLLNPPIPKDQYLSLQLKYTADIEAIIGVDLATDLKILNQDHSLLYLSEVINRGRLICLNNFPAQDDFVFGVATRLPDFYPVLENYYQETSNRLKTGQYAA